MLERLLCPKMKRWLGQHMSMYNGTSVLLVKVHMEVHVVDIKEPGGGVKIVYDYT